MERNKSTPNSIDEYISRFSAEVQETLQTLRKVLHETAPEATEKISYQMPTFYLRGNLVYFAAYKNHIGFYPGASGIEAFSAKLLEYKWAKGTVRFPLDKPLPYDLIREIVKLRVAENMTKAAGKLKKPQGRMT